MKHLAIIWHSMTGGSKALAEAAADGARGAEAVEIVLLRAEAATPETLLNADGCIFVFPENLAAISGVMKTFFDRAYYPCLGRIEGRPYALLVCAGSDGRNAVRQAERIATGWRLKKVAESLIVCTDAQTTEAILAPKVIDEADLITARELGATFAEGVALGVF
jgi:multimeric flavodoxin WrbA